MGEVGDCKPGIHDRIHRHHRAATACAVKSDESLGSFRCRRCQLCEIECAAMIVLFDGVSDLLESRWRMIELTRNLDPELRMPPDGVIINRDAAIGRDNLAPFTQHQRIDYK